MTINTFMNIFILLIMITIIIVFHDYIRNQELCYRVERAVFRDHFQASRGIVLVMAAIFSSIYKYFFLGIFHVIIYQYSNLILANFILIGVCFNCYVGLCDFLLCIYN